MASFGSSRLVLTTLARRSIAAKQPRHVVGSSGVFVRSHLHQPLQQQQQRYFLESATTNQSAAAVAAANASPFSSFEYGVDDYEVTGPAPPRRILRTSFDLPDPARATEEMGSYGKNPLQLTKIVATIGPKSEQLPVLEQVVKQGMRIMRLNFSHATVEEVELRTLNLGLLQNKTTMADGDEVYKCPRAILLDTKGPEIRTGILHGDHSGHETVTLRQGETIILHTTEHWAEQGSTATDLFVDYPKLHKALRPGRKVLLDDGSISLTVLETESEKEFHGLVTCRIDNTGDLRSRAGVNLPLADTSDLPAMSEKDRGDIKYGMTKDIDFVAASFVQTGAGVREIRRHIQQCALELGWPAGQPLPLIISKIESASALSHFDEILKESDGIMVARGDLGVEIPLQQVTNAQKEMVAACNAVGKPVIVATQMLESMAKNPRPTRAEVSDVTNAVYDGADAVMLSGETAKGKYPVEAVKMMNEIILGAERFAKSGVVVLPEVKFRTPVRTPETALAKAAATAAEKLSAAVILVTTTDGRLPALVSAYRPKVPILVFCPSPKVGRQLMLHRGIHPITGLSGVSTSKRPEAAVKDAKNMGFVAEGDQVIIVAMEENGLGRHGTMKIAKVP